MARRRVTQSRKDEDGDITALCNPSQTWSPRYKTGAISDIENGTHTYYVRVGNNEVVVRVKGAGNNKYLTTAADSNKENNLDNLPDC